MMQDLIRYAAALVAVAASGDAAKVGFDNSAAQDSITPSRGDELAHELGALCIKIFAAR